MPPHCFQLVAVDIGLNSVTFTYHDIGKLDVTIVGNLDSSFFYVRIEPQNIILGNFLADFLRPYNGIHVSTLCASVKETCKKIP